MDSRFRRIALEVEATTTPQKGHPHPEYGYRCDVTLLGEPLFSRWGRTADAAQKSGEWQLRVNLRKLLSRPA